MIILRKLYQFKVNIKDLIQIYILYIRSLVEQACVVWASSITQQEVQSIERVQKVALRVILKDKYISYTNALQVTKLPSLSDRRTKLCLKFALKCTKNERCAKMFPLNKQTNTRHTEKFSVPFARTERFKNSAIPYMARLLNSTNSK